MANERRLIMLDYNAVREAFDEEFKKTMQLIQNGETHLDNLAEGFTEADRVLRKMPTVDAVRVVHCKDCKWYRASEVFFPQKFCYRLKHPKENRKVGYPYEPDGFCSYGERMDGGEEDA